MTNKRKDVVFFLKNPEYLLSIAILAVILLSSLMQVLNRLFPAIKAPWTLELITYLFGALIWIGIAHWQFTMIPMSESRASITNSRRRPVRG